MKTSIVAALLVRIVGLVLIVMSLPAAAFSVISGIIPDGVSVAGGADGPTSIFVNDRGDIIAVLGSVILPLLVGVGMIVFSKPLGRLLAKGLPEQ